MTDFRMTERNDEQLEAVQGSGLLDFIGELLFDRVTDKVEQYTSGFSDGCTGKQVMPGFNVY